MTQLALPVRGTDPDTSYEAAVKAVAHASKYRPIVLAIVEEHGPLTLDELIGHFRYREVMDGSTPHASDSGIRTRLSELRRMRLVVRHPENGVSALGNSAKRWMVVPADDFVTTPDMGGVDPAMDDEDIVQFTDDAA